MKCRYCGKELVHTVVDLGLAPLSNDYLTEQQISEGQHILPLKVAVCDECYLVQIVNYEMPDNIFSEKYKYFSSFSTTWLKHCEEYVDMIVKKLKLTPTSKIVEIASNDGYLLQYFKKYQIEPLGIEPSKLCAKEAIRKGISTKITFFNSEYAKQLVQEGEKADLIIGNNVLAHVPNIGDFVEGIKILLKPEGMVTLEFPHLLNVLKLNQFDTIYHEHFSYLSIITLQKIFSEKGLKIIKIEQLPTHGGSLRVFATHVDNNSVTICESVQAVLLQEEQFGLNKMETYAKFWDTVKNIKYDILNYLITLKKEGKTIVGYGAAAKGNTLFNYCGIGEEFIDYVVDMSPHKQGLYLPGTLIPIKGPDEIRKTRPDFVIIIPWNLEKEIMEQMQEIREWGGKFIICIPTIKIS